ncbi:MAG: DEAD/DEAH box helicase [Vicinamibacterales bacterium]
MPFSTLGLSPSLCTPLTRLGYERPTPVQDKAIPVVLTGADMLARAQTGTGKTAAFGLPMIDRLIVRSTRTAVPKQPRGLVLVPTRELALQVHESLVAFGQPVKLRVAVILGGVSINPQVQALRRGVDIVVATPGRLVDHMQQRTIDLSAVEILVLDEADRMLDMGFLPALRRIVSALPRERQTLLLSATFSPDMERLAGDFTRSAVRVEASPANVVATTVTHHVHPVTEGRKGALLSHVLKQTPDAQALVFCKTKRGSNRVGEYLEQSGVKAAVIHGNKSQNARNRALGDFKAGRVTVLVATDIAARGLDIVQLPLVVNYDLPLVAEDYVHRVGRTGRAGHPGRAVSLVSGADTSLLHGIQRLLPEPLQHVLVDGFEAGRATDAPVDGGRRFGSRGNGRGGQSSRGGGFGRDGARSGARPSSGAGARHGNRPATRHAGSDSASSDRPAFRPSGGRPQFAGAGRGPSRPGGGASFRPGGRSRRSGSPS